MSTPEEHIDQKIRKVFQRNGLESPSPNFTSDVMQTIGELDPESGTEERSASRSWILGIFVGVLLFTGLAIAYFFNVTLLPAGIQDFLTPVFGGLFSSFEGIFKDISISSTTIVIILGFAALVGIERILNKLNITRNIYLSF